MRRAWERMRTAAMRPEDASGLAVFRVLFGLLVAWSALRYELNGWVEQLYVQPRFYFHYWGAAWAVPLTPTHMHALFAIMMAAGVCIALGLAYRLACATFFLAFTYVELIDVQKGHPDLEVMEQLLQGGLFHLATDDQPHEPDDTAGGDAGRGEKSGAQVDQAPGAVYLRPEMVGRLLP